MDTVVGNQEENSVMNKSRNKKFNSLFFFIVGFFVTDIALFAVLKYLVRDWGLILIFGIIFLLVSIASGILSLAGALSLDSDKKIICVLMLLSSVTLLAMVFLR